MPNLSQVLGFRKTADKLAQDIQTRVYHLLQKPGLFDGAVATYTPLNDDATEAEKLPPRNELVQQDVGALLAEFAKISVEQWDRSGAIEYTNSKVLIPVTLPNGVVVENMTPTHLLWLEHQVSHLIHNVVPAIPTLDTSVAWSAERTSEHDAYVSDPVKTFRMAKVRKNHVQWEPPSPEYKQQPQIETYTADEPVGSWLTTRLSKAMPAKDKAELLERCIRLHDAIKSARLKANEAEVENAPHGQAMWDYLLG